MNPVLMPAQAYRRTWFADRLDELCGRGLFGAIFRQLAPAEHARVRNANPNAQAAALLRHLRKHCFPINDYIESSIAEAGGEGEFDWNDLLYMGIPMDVFGFDFENDCDGDDVMVFHALSRDPEIRANFFGVFDKYDLDDYADSIGKIPTCPRGREWIAPWGDLSLMFEWINSGTGNRWLDYNNDMLEEGGCPPWNVEEIRALANDWKRSEPDIQRLGDLRNFLQAKPETKIPLLAGALAGDKDVIHRITRPKRVKPLSEVWR